MNNPTTEQTVLENTHMPTNCSANKPRIIDFYGFEGEDFRYFKSILETFFSLSGITQDSSRVNILRTRLRRAAGVYFDKCLEKRKLTQAKISYNDAIKLLQDHYITEQHVQTYELAFNEMYQFQGESPQVFLSRLYEAADLADIQEEKLIHSRFRAGLLPALKTFCREQSASSFEQWVRHSEGWWNAHAPQTINLVENPFVSNTKKIIYPTEVNMGKNLLNEKSVRFTNERVNALKDVNSKIYKSNNKAYSVEESPNMAALTAKLEALDLHQLIPLIDSNEHANENVIQSLNTESFKTNNGLKTFIKNVVQEVVENDMKEDFTNNDSYYDSRKFNSRRIRRNPRNYEYRKNELFFDNDAACPNEGYYVPRRQYDNYNENRSRYNYNNAGYSNNYNNTGYSNYNGNSYKQPMRQNSQSNYYNSDQARNYNNDQTRNYNNDQARSYPYDKNNSGPHYTNDAKLNQNYNQQGSNQGNSVPPYNNNNQYRNREPRNNYNNNNQNSNQYSKN